MTVRQTTLENGLRVVSHTMDAVETVSVGVFVDVGTRDEPVEINGVAHLLEHMAFKGTERRSALDIVAEIEEVGGHLNAYTSREHTAYYAKVLKEDTPLAVDILADILQHSTFEPDELARERSVVLQEIGQAHDTPDDIVFDHFQATAFPDQPLGRPVLGDAERVRSMSREAIMDYMDRAYGAGSMVLSAAGMIEHDDLVSLARHLFRDLADRQPLANQAASYGGGAHLVDRDLEQIHLTVGFPGLGMHDPDIYAGTVMSALLGGGMSSRLFQEIRERRGLVYSIHSYCSSYSDCGLFGIYAGTGEDEIAELMPVVAEEVRRLGSSLNEGEVRRARNQLKAGTLMSLESTGARAEQLGEQMLVFGRPLPIEEIVSRIDAVDVDAVRRVADRVFSGRPSIAAIGPLAQMMPYDRFAERLTA